MATDHTGNSIVEQPQYRLKLYRGIWCVTWQHGGRTRRCSLGTAERDLAERRFQDFLHRLRTPPKPDTFTVATIFAAYRDDRHAEGIPVARIDYAWQHLCPVFGACKPVHIDKVLCKDYIDKRRRAGAADGTIRKELGILATALNWAEGEHWFDIGDQPGRAPTVHRPPQPPPRDRWLTQDEGRGFVSAAVAAHIRLFILLALYTAARTAAILELTWAQVNERFIDFKPPGALGRRKGRAVVPMNAPLWAALTEAKKAAVSPYVIEYAGDRVASVKTGIRATARRAGLADVTPHVLRHTAATWMAEAGVEMRKISLYLGHNSVEVTERIYAKHSPKYLADGAAAVVAALEGAPEARKEGTG